MNNLHNQRSLSRSRLPLATLAEDFAIWTVEVGFSEYTATIRRQALARFVGWCRSQGIISPGQLTDDVVEEYQLFLGRYRTSKGYLLMPTTQATRLNPIKAFCKWLYRHRLVKADPAATLTLPRLPRRLPSYVPSEEEVQRVMAVPDTTTAYGLRDRAILELFYSSAIRRLEMMSLKISDFQADRGVVWIRDGKGGKDRVVPVGPRAIKWMQRYLRNRKTQRNTCVGEALFLDDFGDPFVGNRLGDVVKRYLKRSGISTRGSCHLFRHACATHMLEHGADIRFIQEMLGHSSLSTTQIYTRLAITKLKHVHSSCHPTGGPLGRDRSQ